MFDEGRRAEVIARFDEHFERHYPSATAECGLALLRAKALVPHGQWGGAVGWLAANFRGSERTAQVYMQLAANPQRAADLDAEQSIRGALKGLGGGAPVKRAKPDPDAKASKAIDVLWQQTSTLPADKMLSIAKSLRRLLAELGEDDKAYAQEATVDDALDAVWSRSLDLADDDKARAAENLRALANNLSTPDIVDAVVIPDSVSPVEVVNEPIATMEPTVANAELVAAALSAKYGSWDNFVLAVGDTDRLPGEAAKGKPKKTSPAKYMLTVYPVAGDPQQQPVAEYTLTDDPSEIRYRKPYGRKWESRRAPSEARNIARLTLTDSDGEEVFTHAPDRKAIL